MQLQHSASDVVKDADTDILMLNHRIRKMQVTKTVSEKWSIFNIL